MDNQVQKFDPATLMQGVKDRIKATFASLIPDDQWQAMVDKEIQWFFYHLQDQHVHIKEPVSPFGQLCRQVLKEESLARLKDYISTEEFNLKWSEFGQPIISKSVEDLLINNAGTILMKILAQPFLMHLDQMKYEIRNEIKNR